MKIEERLEAFIKLGEYLKFVPEPVETIQKLKAEQIESIKDLQHLVNNYQYENPWFIPENIELSLAAISNSLSRNKVELWIRKYKDQLKNKKKVLIIGVVMAGNIPLVGFQDFFNVLISGNKFLGKLSSDDNKLLPALNKLLVSIEPGFEEMVLFKDGRLSGFDAIIATGSDNTARYFDYYFGKYPNIIRKNRNGIAVLSGKENEEELRALGHDIFAYFGLGCRNVSKIYIPHSFSFELFFNALKDYDYVMENFKYKNNYDYYKSIYLLNKENFMDNGFLILKENINISSAVSTLYYEYYDDADLLTRFLKENEHLLQCIVADKAIIPGAIHFGTSQFPGLCDYADNIDTMNFLLGLS